jgi:GNAT superfamily N-acetyltransferase
VRRSAIRHADELRTGHGLATPLRITQDYRSERTLADGTRIRLRLLTPQDREALVRGFERLSPESRYRRFFTAMPRLPDSLLTKLTITDNRDHLAVVAERLDADGRPGEGLGVARFVRLADAPDSAEAAVAVVDDMQRRGVGTMLLSVLSRAAAERGITKFRCYVQVDNEASKGLIHTLARNRDVHFDGGTFLYEVELPSGAPEQMRASGLYRLFKLAADELRVVFRALGAGDS